MHDFGGTVLADRFALEQEIGRGGMATVWQARDLRHERPVAVKIIHPELAGAIGVDRFIREVLLTARLQHPGIVPILDSGVLQARDGTTLPWYAMPYLDGESLRMRIDRDRQLPVEEALRITEEVGEALQAAHKLDIVHRDIKPENVLLSDGHVYVVDFGIAKALIETGVERLTSTGLAVGTPAYMSPEQALADRVDARSDQYSLASVLYEMLAGEPPFSGATAQAIVARRLAEPVRPLITVRSSIPVPVERAVLKALERAPADRFPDVQSFITALRDTTSPGSPRTARRVSIGSRAFTAASLLGLAALGAWLIVSRGRAAGTRARSPEAVALYRRGMQGYDRRTPGGLVDAVTALNAAIARDSAYALAWTALAKSYVRAHERQFALPGLARDSLLPRAVAAVDRALAIDPRNADAWLTQAMVSQRVDPTDLGPTLRPLRQAVTLDSTSGPAWHAYARTLAETGALAGGLDAWRRCVKVSPAYTQGVAFLALAHYWQRQYDSAAVWADSAIALDPNYLLGRITVGFVALERQDFARAAAAFDAARRLSTDVELVNSLAGSALVAARASRVSEARATLRRAEILAVAYVPTPLHPAVYIAQAYAALGDMDRAVSWLVRYEPRRDLHFQLHLRCDPPFDRLKSDQRFRALLTQPAPPPGPGC